MEMIINNLKKFTAAGLILLCSFAGAQSSDGSLSMQVLSPVLRQDTGKANKNNRTLNFTLNVKAVNDLRSFKVLLVDQDNKTIVDLGEYEAKRHENGFYYVENRSKEKMTVLNNDIYFSKLIKAEDLPKIKTLSLSYQSLSNQVKTVKTELPVSK